MAKNKRRHSYILVILTVCVLTFSLGLFAWLQKDIKAKENELRALQNDLQSIQEANDEINYLLNEADEDELYEHLARERDFVYPDEHIYKDVTPGN